MKEKSGKQRKKKTILVRHISVSPFSRVNAWHRFNWVLKSVSTWNRIEPHVISALSEFAVGLKLWLGFVDLQKTEYFFFKESWKSTSRHFSVEQIIIFCWNFQKCFNKFAFIRKNRCMFCCFSAEHTAVDPVLLQWVTQHIVWSFG